MEKLSPAALEARRQYQREWRRANRDKCKAYQTAYWERRAAKARGGAGEGDR